MKQKILILALAAVVMSACSSEYNRVLKTTDYDYKYEVAKEYFVMGKYAKASSLLQELVTITKGHENGQECLYMLAMCEYCMRDYDIAADYFKKYSSSYPRGKYAENAAFYRGQSLYLNTPEPRLDQSDTYAAIAAFQEYLDLFPYGKMKRQAQERLFTLQDKLVMKELHSAQLYFDLGNYFMNCSSGESNFEACIITSQNAIKDYPYTKMREKFAVLIMKSKFGLAEQSVDEKKLERYRDAEDECYGFINEYPDSKERKTAEKYIAQCKKVTKG